MKPVEVIRQTRLFRDLGAEHQRALASIATEDKLAAGGELVRQGDHNENIHLIGIGTVKVLKAQGSEEEEVARLSTGATLGEMAFVDAEPRSTTVVAVEHTELITLPGAVLRELLAGDAELRAAFYQAIAGVLTLRLRGATDNVATLRTVLSRH